MATQTVKCTACGRKLGIFYFSTGNFHAISYAPPAAIATTSEAVTDGEESQEGIKVKTRAELNKEHAERNGYQLNKAPHCNISDRVVVKCVCGKEIGLY